MIDKLAKKLQNKLNKKYTENIRDKYHSMGELYEFRKVLNANLFNEWHKSKTNNCYKSYRHSDGKLCFGGGWFIVIANTQYGQISFHYENKDWFLFKIPVVEKPDSYDGHTAKDALKRLFKLIR